MQFAGHIFVHALFVKAYPDEHREQLVFEVHKAHISGHDVQAFSTRKNPLKHFVQPVLLLLVQVLQPSEHEISQAFPFK
jgi:hypothetical protein